MDAVHAAESALKSARSAKKATIRNSASNRNTLPLVLRVGYSSASSSLPLMPIISSPPCAPASSASGCASVTPKAGVIASSSRAGSAAPQSGPPSATPATPSPSSSAADLGGAQTEPYDPWPAVSPDGLPLDVFQRPVPKSQSMQSASVWRKRIASPKASSFSSSNCRTSGSAFWRMSGNFRWICRNAKTAPIS